jgi:hypothetical protein
VSAIWLGVIVGWVSGWLVIVAWTWVQAARNAVADRHAVDAVGYEHLVFVVILGLVWPAAVPVLGIVAAVLRADRAIRIAVTPKPPPEPAPLPEAVTYREVKP